MWTAILGSAIILVWCYLDVRLFFWLIDPARLVKVEQDKKVEDWLRSQRDRASTYTEDQEVARTAWSSLLQDSRGPVPEGGAGPTGVLPFDLHSYRDEAAGQGEDSDRQPSNEPEEGEEGGRHSKGLHFRYPSQSDPRPD